MRCEWLPASCLVLFSLVSAQLDPARADECAGRPDFTSCTEDANSCTSDYCLNGVCNHPNRPAGDPCDPPNPPCRKNECDAGGTCIQVMLPDGAACPDEGNPCTDDKCSSGQCVHPNKVLFTACPDDANECTVDFCDNGVCTHPPKNDAVLCNSDGNPCTADACRNGVCAHECFADGTGCTTAGGQPGACKTVGAGCNCFSTGRCCLPSQCSNLVESDCTSQLGTYIGDGTTCYVQSVIIGSTKTVLSWAGNGSGTYDIAFARVVNAAVFNGDFSVFSSPTGGSCASGCGVSTTSYDISCKGVPLPPGMDMWLVRDRGAGCPGSWNDGYQVGTRDAGSTRVPSAVCP